MGKITKRQRIEREDRVRRGLDPYFKWAKPRMPMFFGQGRTRLDRRDQGLDAGAASKSAAGMAYRTRLDNYLRQHGPAAARPEVHNERACLTGPQRRRLDSKLAHALTARERQRQGWTRARMASVLAARRHAHLGDPQAQAALREAAWQLSPAERAERRREARRSRRGTHQYRAQPGRKPARQRSVRRG